MIKYLLLFTLIPIFTFAEPFPIHVTEGHSPEGELGWTCFYYCVCTRVKGNKPCNCTDWQDAGEFNCEPSDDGIGGKEITHEFDVPIQFLDLPMDVRYSATSLSLSENETPPGEVSATHRFNRP